MAAPLLLLGLAAVSGIGTGAYVFRAGAGEKDLTARIAGVPAVPALAIGGGLLSLMAGGWMLPIGLGVVIGSLVGGYGLGTVKEGMDAYVQRQIAAGRVPDGGNNPMAPAPPALPGPDAPAPPPEAAPAPGAGGGGGFMNWLFGPAQQPAAA